MQRRLTTGQLLAYACLGAPLTALTLPLVVYLPPFYAKEIGLPLALVGAAFTTARLWDVITDPIVGWMQDRTQVRWGRRKAWIAGGIPILMLGVYAVTHPPENVDLTYLYAILFFLYVGFTMSQLGHFSWGGELSTDYHERSRIHGWRETAAVAGMLSILAVPAAIQSLGLGDQADAVSAMGWFVIVSLPLLAVISLTIAPEPPQPPPRQENWIAGLRTVWANRPLRRALLGEFLSGFAPGVTGVLFVFFFSSVLGLGGSANLLLLVYFVGGLIGVPLWIQVSYRFGKHRTLGVAVIYQAAMLLGVVFLPPGQMASAAAAMFLAGLAANAAPFLLRSIVSDVVDKDRLETGEQRTGLFFGLMLLAAKIGLAIAPAITFGILAAVGFDSAPGAANSDGALTVLTALFIGAPVLANLLLAALMWSFPIDEAAQTALQDAIARKETGA